VMGEGWGEGEYNAISTGYIPLPFVPSHQGRGNLTSYECINIDELVKSRIHYVAPACALHADRRVQVIICFIKLLTLNT